MHIAPRTPARFLAYFVIVIAGFFGLLLLALATFPGAYSIAENSVSNLGRPDVNPNGWFYFSMAMWFVAFALVPLYATIFRVVDSKQTRVTSVITMILFALTSAGMFMAGTFQEGSAFDKLHLYSAYLGFGGFFLAGIFTWILVGIRLARGNVPGRARLAGVLCCEVAILGTAAIAFIVHLVLKETGQISFGGDPIGWFIGFPFTEWMLVLAIFADKVLLAFILAALLRGEPFCTPGGE